MDLTGIFLGRKFNSEIKTTDIAPLPKVPSIPFNPPFKRNFQEEQDYQRLTDYYRTMEGSEDDIDYLKTHPFLNHNKMVDYDAINTEEDDSHELTLIRSYHKDEKYIDNNNNIYEIKTRTDTYVEVILNGHLPKYHKNKVIKLTRDNFLEKMGYRLGGDTDLYAMQNRYENFEKQI